jgi:hypothetical protein
MDYFFELKQKIWFQVLHGDSTRSHETIGDIETTLGELVGSKSQTFIREIKGKNDKKMGKLVVRCEKVQINNSSLTLQFSAKDLLDVAGFFSTNNPVFKLYRTAGDSGYVAVYESEVVKKTKHP